MNKSGGEAHIFLTKNRFVPILKERAVSLVASVVGYSITREKPSHDCRGGNHSGSKQKVNVIGRQGPSVARSDHFGQHPS